MTTPLDRRVSIAGRVKAYLPYTQARPEYVAEGRLLRMVGLTLEAIGCKVPIGGHCTIRSPEAADIEAEVVAGERDTRLLGSDRKPPDVLAGEFDVDGLFTRARHEVHYETLR